MSSGYNLGIASSVSCTEVIVFCAVRWVCRAKKLSRCLSSFLLAYESHSAVFVTRHVTHIEVLWLGKLEIGCVTLESCSAA